MEQVEPSVRTNSFSCPRCRAYANQFWFTIQMMGHGGLIQDAGIHQDIGVGVSLNTGSTRSVVTGLFVSQCYACKRLSLWRGGTLLWPSANTAPAPHVDLPQSLMRDYEEAAAVLDASPRAAAGLLRLAVEKLCVELGATGTINEMIAQLVANGLSVRVQQMLDALRVIGNEAVHPGTMDLTDDRDTALSLFRMLNLVVEKMIAEPRHIEEAYGKLPAAKLAGIEQRDAKKS